MSPNGVAPEDVGREPSPYVELDRAAWADLGRETTSPLSAEEVASLRGLGDALGDALEASRRSSRSISPSPGC